MTNPADVLDGITQINNSLYVLNRSLEKEVARARRVKCSWQEIGDALGISRQAAWEQFSRLERQGA
jgi:predicted ArsR family transcriptional regulator